MTLWTLFTTRQEKKRLPAKSLYNFIHRASLKILAQPQFSRRPPKTVCMKLSPSEIPLSQILRRVTWAAPIRGRLMSSNERCQR